MDKSFTQLLALYEAGELYGDDLTQFFLLLEKDENQSLLSAAIDEKVANAEFMLQDNPLLTERAIVQLRRALESTREQSSRKRIHRINFLKTAWFRYAAAIIILFGVGAYLWSATQNKRSTLATIRTVRAEKDIAPGRDGAILTLADGTRLVLDSLANRIIANQNGAQVTLKDGQLAYVPAGKSSGNTTYNTMTTPRGRQFHVQLPDGTQVWLNSESSIRFPTVFVGKERRVEITGEVYFEVAKNRLMPFIVQKKDLAVRVLGTTFNVNAYDDEKSIDITLVEGSVETIKGRAATTLKPGQQAKVQDNGDIHLINNADITSAIAWKNGYFQFNGASLESVMRQISRWYDVEFSYERKMEERHFVGQIDRAKSLRSVLKILEESNVRFRIEGKKIVVR